MLRLHMKGKNFMPNREERKLHAEDTIEIVKKGWYDFNFGTRQIFLNNTKNSELWMQKDLDVLVQKNNFPLNFSNTKMEMRQESVIDTIFALQKDGTNGERIGILNFASAYNPGGGFINGSMAQEEAMAYASDLYFQQQGSDYYKINKNEKSKLYTDTAIFSKVTFFRDSNFYLVPEPYAVNVITCPAVNMSAISDSDAKRANDVMYERMKKILSLFAEKSCSTIVLGAWGCGVFRNCPRRIAKNWNQLLRDEKMQQYFEQIIFTVLASSKEIDTLKAFNALVREDFTYGERNDKNA